VVQVYIKGVQEERAEVVRIIEIYHSSAGPFFEALRAEDEVGMAEACSCIDVLKRIHMRDKWDDADFKPSR